LPTVQLGEAADEMPEFSARSGSPQSRRMTKERLSVKESPLQEGRFHAPAPRRNLRIIGQLDSAATHNFTGSTRLLAERRGHEIFKRMFDVFGAIVLGLVFLPLVVTIAILLRIEGAPIIFRHRRVGRDGKAFDCLKFRSMVPEADKVLRELLDRHPELRAEWLHDHKLKDDPRVTAVGRFLRRTSLDELPQLWNVIRGDMSLVGPRPVVREELLRYGRCAGIYLSARPGITGLWQVTGRNDTNYRQRVVLDVYYVRRQNLLLDLYILAKTTAVVLGGGGAY